MTEDGRYAALLAKAREIVAAAEEVMTDSSRAIQTNNADYVGLAPVLILRARIHEWRALAGDAGE